MNRIRFARLNRSVQGDQHNLTRSHPGDQDAIVAANERITRYNTRNIDSPKETLSRSPLMAG